MISYFQLRRERRKLVADVQALAKHYQKELLEAKKAAKSKDEINRIISMQDHEYILLSDQLDIATTAYWRRRCADLVVPMPGYDNEEMWQYSNQLGEKYLTTNGIVQVKSAIRTEQRERIANLGQIIVILTGLVGALTGLVAAIGSL